MILLNISCRSGRGENKIGQKRYMTEITIIQAKKGWVPIDFKELWRYREAVNKLRAGRLFKIVG